MDSSDASARPKSKPGVDAASRRRSSGRWTAAASHRQCCLNDSRNARRACRFLLSPSDTISRMATESPDEARVGLLIRMQLHLHDGLRSRAAREHTSINTYLERLVRRDLNEADDVDFVAVPSPKFAARGKNGRGRPTKGTRKGMTLRVVANLRQQIKERAESLNLTANDYLESLVSHDISAARLAAKEGMVLHQTA